MKLFMRGAVAAVLMAATGQAHGAIPADPSGTWLTEDGRARIRVERCPAIPEQICGYIVWMKEPLDAKGAPFRDQYNPDPAKRLRPVLGHQLLLGLKLTPEGRYEGQIYNAEDGKSYSVALWRETSDRLKLKGCMLTFLCSTQTWLQTNDVLLGQLVSMTGDADGPRADREWALQPQARLKPPPAKAAR